jgi:hypothetical protein
MSTEKQDHLLLPPLEVSIESLGKSSKVITTSHPKQSSNVTTQKLYKQDLDKAERVKQAIRDQLLSKTCFSLNVSKEVVTNG